MIITVEWPTPNVHIAISIMFTMGIICFVATVLALIVYFRSSAIRKAYQNLFFLNLLVNELMLSCIYLYFFGNITINKNSEIYAPKWVCALDGYLEIFCCCMEVYALMCIAIERYYSIRLQKPLTKKQMIAMIVFGYCWIGFVLSPPLWHPSFYFIPSDAKLYCTYPFHDPTQLLTSIICILQITLCAGVTCFCYIQIYRYTMSMKKNRHDNVMSTISDGTSKNEVNDKEIRLFWITLLLAGWTIIGWTPMLLMVIAQTITGNSNFYNWDMVAGVLYTAVVSGDSLILLLFDKRWNSTLREMVSDFRKKLG